jgi:hypothetical protein
MACLHQLWILRTRIGRLLANEKSFSGLSIVSEKSGSPTIPKSTVEKIAISNKVGGVKHFLSTLLDALEEERHFALVGGLRFPNEYNFAGFL